MFNLTTRKNDEGRYEVMLPWKDGHPPLPTNFSLAKRRMEQTAKKLKDCGKYEAYDLVFHEWLEEKIIEIVEDDEKMSGKHYLPHRPVFKEGSATTKIRPVFDASAKERGCPSLNDCLEKGPNLLELIPNLLIKFRKEKIGVTSDIRKAFLQVSVNEEERDFLRFVWKNADGIERICRHRRVVFGVNASPFLLGATIQFHLKKCLQQCEQKDYPYSESTITKLEQGFYVDNCVTSVSDENSLNMFIAEATSLMAEAGFELRCSLTFMVKTKQYHC